jgi:IS605 OrfB family transposase
LFISLPLENKPKDKIKQKLALGVDLGIRRPAAMSDGRIIIDRKFNGEKRKLRHLKDELKSKGTKSARRHLDKLRHKEHYKNKNQTHLIANEILKTSADTIVLENLKGIKAKKHKFQNKNGISQVPLFELRRILTYKAENQGKTVLLVSPAYTSQTDSFSGLREGERRGCRFVAKSGIVYDADLNAARNIGNRSKLPVSYGNILDGQASVNGLNVCKSSASREVLQTPIPLG